MCNGTATSQPRSPPIDFKQISSLQGLLDSEQKMSRPRPNRVKQISSLQGFLLESDSFHFNSNESLSLSESFSTIDCERSICSSSSTMNTSVSAPTSVDMNVELDDSDHIRVLARELRRAKRRSLLKIFRQAT